jgi:hypothetical protein
MLIQKQSAPDAFTRDLLCTFLRFAACMMQQFFAVFSSFSLISSNLSAISIENNLSIHRHHHHHHLSH